MAAVRPGGWGGVILHFHSPLMTALSGVLYLGLPGPKKRTLADWSRSSKERLRERGLFSLKKRHLTAVFCCLMVGCRKDGVKFFSEVHSGKIRGKIHKCSMWKKLFSYKSGQALEQVAQWGCEYLILGHIQTWLDKILSNLISLKLFEEKVGLDDLQFSSVKNDSKFERLQVHSK